MEKRYQMFERLGVENIEGFNQRSSEKLPRILFLFDEFGDLWDSCTKAQVDKLENLIIRLGQKARAAGVHLVVFTHRPKKVVSPRLRSNCPARVLLTVADSGHWISLIWWLKRFLNKESSKSYEVEVNPPKLALS